MAREIRVNDTGDSVAVRSNHPIDSTLAWGVLNVTDKGIARGAWGKDADISQWSNPNTGAREIRVAPDGDQVAMKSIEEDWDWAVLSMKTTKGSRPEGKRLAEDAEVADWEVLVTSD